MNVLAAAGDAATGFPAPGHILASLVVMGAVTVLLRWLPFVFIRSLRDSALVGFLGVTMPVGVMAALVAYTLTGRTGDPGGWWAAPVALAATVALHLWRRSAAVSILAGTALYMLLVNMVA